MGRARLQLLGGFGLHGARAPVDLTLGLQRLVAFLAVRGAAHRCLVAGTLWPDVPEQQALASLRTGMWRMNRLVPGVVRAAGLSLTLAPSMTIDAGEQERFATRVLRERADDDRWVLEGIDLLLLGELLPGWYDDWVVSERERLNQLRLHALERSAAILTRSRQLDVALHLALEAVRAEPLRETANATLMSVYLAEGNVSDAVHHYECFRDLLLRELGLEPSPTVGQLLPRRTVLSVVAPPAG